MITEEYNFIIRNGNEQPCDKDLFFSKLNAILQYFTIKYLSKDKDPIGFKPPVRD